MGALAPLLRRQRMHRDTVPMVWRLAQELYQAKKHLLVLVTSARPLSTQMSKKIERDLQHTFLATTLTASYEVDPALLGGIQLRTPFGVWRWSIQDRLHQLTRSSL